RVVAGDAPRRRAERGRAIGAMVRTVQGQEFHSASIAAWGLDEWARDNLLAYLRDQHRATGVLPTDKTIVVERFRDELGDWRVVIHTPFGARVHAPWALVIGERIRTRFGIDAAAMHSDDGIVLRLPSSDLEFDDLDPQTNPSGNDLELTELFMDP